MIETDSPGIDERYSTACASSNLRVTADRTSGADILIAAAWSESRLGAALLRLHSEWDGIAKPHKVSQAATDAFARTLKGNDGEKRAKAAKITNDWYLHECGLLLGRLKTMPDVRHQCILVLEKWNIEGAREIGPAVLLHWLNAKCPTCHGQKFVVIPETPVLSTKMCRTCRGSGDGPTPFTEVGRRLENYLDDCVSRARTSIKSRLHLHKIRA